MEGITDYGGKRTNFLWDSNLVIDILKYLPEAMTDNRRKGVKKERCNFVQTVKN